jgi:hypothetical protein
MHSTSVPRSQTLDWLSGSQTHCMLYAVQCELELCANSREGLIHCSIGTLERTLATEEVDMTSPFTVKTVQEVICVQGDNFEKEINSSTRIPCEEIGHLQQEKCYFSITQWLQL